MRSRKRRKQNKGILKNSILKIVVVLTIVGLNWAGLSAVGQTVSYFFDTEDSYANTLLAGILDFELSSPTTNFAPEEIATAMGSGDSVAREISVIRNGNPFKYNAWTVKTAGDDDFCNALTLEARLDGNVIYSDGLMNFNVTPPVEIGGDGQDDWLFTVTLPASFPPGKVCSIKFVFEGWQTRYSDASGGYTDIEEIASSFATGGIKINKVYYDVDAEHGSEIDNEWIEVYNPLENSVDISGWTIEDNTGADVIPASNPIPAQGFAIITAASSTWQYWEIPDGVVKIVLTDGIIGGDGLDNDSDRVILKMPGGTEDDAMSYGGDTYAFDPACTDVDEGHILARIPTGFDTNQASDWQDIGLPTVDLIVPSGGEVWYVGHYYDLQWTATNPNGDDSLLSVDLWYSNDSGNTWANIVKGTANDGVYNWRVPLFMPAEGGGCYYVPSSIARIKVVVWGPENFMVQEWDMSDDFCPPIDLDLLTPEEIAFLIENGLYEGPIPEDLIAQEEVLDEEVTDEEEGEEVVGEEEESGGGGAVEETTGTGEANGDVTDGQTEEGLIDQIVNEIVEQILEDSTSEDTSADSEEPAEETTQEDNLIIEETSDSEEQLSENSPATENEEFSVPDNDSSEDSSLETPAEEDSGGSDSDAGTESGDGGGDSGDSGGGDAGGEDTGE
jgi:hypothetical protein